MTILEIARITGITRKTIGRYVMRKGPHRSFARRLPGKSRVVWTPGVIPIFVGYYTKGTKDGRGRPPKREGPPRH